MRKTLRNLVAGALIAGSLSLLGCPKIIKADMKKVSEAVTQDANAYDEALRIAQNPSAFASGDAVKDLPYTQLAPQTEKSLVEKNLTLEDYFFQGREMDGLRIFNDENEKKMKFPYILSNEEIVNFEKENSWILKNSAKKIGCSIYLPLDSEIENLSEIKPRMFIEEDLSHIEQIIIEFNDEESNHISMEKMKEGSNSIVFGAPDLVFINKNISSIIVPLSMDIEKEKIFVDSLISYAKRIEGEFYPMDNTLFFHQIEMLQDYYSDLDIPFRESAKYLSESLEFQKKFYGLEDEEEIRSLFYKEFNIESFTDKVEKYCHNEINKSELEKELLKYGKAARRKLIFRTQNTNEILSHPSMKDISDIVDSYSSENIKGELLQKIEQKRIDYTYPNGLSD
jgi:hypothetical protein